jgi:hypothetical protein
MATTIEQLRKQFPALEIQGSETGRFVILYCRNMVGQIVYGERFDSYFKAREAQNSSCGAVCRKSHCFLEISEGPQIPRRFRELGWDD